MKIIFMTLILCANLQAQIIISEVLYNTPGNRNNLEWVEIYNSSSRTINLGDYLFISNIDTTHLPADSLLASHTYGILSKHLFSANGEDSFERQWGDGSGIWHDYFSENYLAIEIEMLLPDNEGLVKIIDNHENQIDTFSWSSSGIDGVSFEREDVNNLQSGWHRCSYSSGSTPGLQNSPAPEGILVDVEPRMISINNSVQHPFEITYSIPSNTKLSIEIYDDSGYHRGKLLDNSDTVAGQLNWNGHDSNNHPLPPGVYIILFTLSGSSDATKSIPVVIAP